MRRQSAALNLAALLLAGAIFLYFSFLAPMMADNFIFSRAISPGFASFYTGASVDMAPLTLANAFSQACEMYQTWCGRFGGNLAVYLLFMLPHGLYCAFSAILFMGQIFLLGICIFGNEWRDRLGPGWIFGIACLLWLAVPSFGEAYLWLSVGGQLALFAQAAVFVPYRLAPADLAGRQVWSGVKCMLFFLFCVFACSLDFATSAALPPTAIGACIWLRFWQKIPWSRLSVPIAGALGLCLGASVTLLAPGNAQRLLLTNDLAVQAWLASAWGERFLGWLMNLPRAVLWQFLPLLWLFCGLYALKKRFGSHWLHYFPHAALLFLVPALLTHAAYLFTAWPPSRAFATSAVQLVVCAAIVSNAALDGAASRQKRHFAAAVSVFFLVALASLGIEAIKFYHLDQEMAEREKLFRAAGDEPVYLPPLRTGPDRWQPLGGGLNDISEDPSFWVNRAMAAWHGASQVILQKPFSPESVTCATDDKAHFKGEENSRFENLAVSMEKSRIELFVPGTEHADLLPRISIYYDGFPGLKARLPEWLADALRKLVGNGEGWRRYLVLLLLARADIPLTSDGAGHLCGKSANLSLDSKDRLWLVNPLAGPLSPDILPLVCSPRTE